MLDIILQIFLPLLFWLFLISVPLLILGLMIFGFVGWHKDQQMLKSFGADDKTIQLSLRALRIMEKHLNEMQGKESPKDKD